MLYDDEEINWLLNNYVGASVEEIQNRFPNRKVKTVRAKANQLGLKNKKHSSKWTGAETSLLIEKSALSELVLFFPNRSEEDVLSKAKRLKLFELERKNFSNEEDNRLKENYVSATWEELLEILLGRSIGTITNRSNQLGLKKRDIEKKNWSAEEKEKLRSLYPKGTKKELLEVK